MCKSGLVVDLDVEEMDFLAKEAEEMPLDPEGGDLIRGRATFDLKTRKPKPK